MKTQISANKRKMLNLCLYWFSCGILIAIMLIPNWVDLLSVAAFICAGVALLRLTCRGHFAFIGESAHQNMEWLPWLPFCPLCLVILVGISGRQYFEIVIPLGCSLAAGLFVGLLLVVFRKELRQSFDSVFVIVVASVLLCTGIVVQGNHLWAKEQFVFYQLPIMEMYKSGVGNSTDYNCIVQFPDGRELTVDVGSRAEYEKYQVGDTLIIPIRTGAFGIEYGIYGYEE